MLIQARLHCAVLLLLLLVTWSSSYAEEDEFELITDADTTFYEGDLVKALERYEKVLKLNPDNVYALNKKALILVKLNQATKAKETYAKIVAVEPSDTFSHYWLGILALQDEDTELAFREFSRIIEIDPNDSNATYAHMFLGAIYTFRHQPHLAILELNKAKQKANKPEVHYKVARAYHDAGMFANATLEYVKTLKMEPGNIMAMDGLGWIYYNQSEVDKALALWKKALEVSQWKSYDLMQNIAKAYIDRAMIEYQKGNITQARAHWNQVLKYDRQNKAAQHYLAKTK